MNLWRFFPKLFFLGSLSFLNLAIVALFYSTAIAQTVILDEPITSVSQLRDIQPTDWAYSALQSLIDRYDVIMGYPDGTFQGNRTLTRYEFAAALNAVIERVNELISTDSRISRNDLATLQRLRSQFASELTILKSRLNILETRTAELEDNQFSMTTKLSGRVIWAMNAGGFGGTRIISPTGEEIATDDPNATMLHRVSLNLTTSFNGSDQLRILIETGSGGANDNASAVLEPNFGSFLDYSAKPPREGDFGLSRVVYTFKPWDNFSVSIGSDIRTTDYADLNSYANRSFEDFSTSALVNNYILFPINGPSAGTAFEWNPGAGHFTLRALYAAADAANPSRQGAIAGVAFFTRLLYPNENMRISDRGLFGDTYQGTIELEYSPSDNFAMRVQYSGGKVFNSRFDVFGANVEWRVTEQIALFGRYGYGSYNNTAFGDIAPNYWMAGIAFPDLFREGAVAGIAAGQPFIAGEIGNSTQTNFEAYYNIPINNNLHITPLLQVITDASNQSDNGFIWTGTLRTVFSF